MDVDVDPDWGPPKEEEPAAATAASDSGAGALGLTRRARERSGTAAAGLTTLPGDEFGDGPRIPMLPGTWDQEADDG